MKKEISTDIINSNNQYVTINTETGVILQSNSNRVVRMVGVAGGDKPRVELHAVRGTIDEPEILHPGDYGVTLSFTTYSNENSNDISKSLVSLISRMDPTAVSTDNAPASSLIILAGAGDGQGEVLNDYRGWRFNKDGGFETKIIQCIEQSTLSINSIEPKNGMIVYNDDTHKFQGYANGVWVDLH